MSYTVDFYDSLEHDFPTQFLELYRNWQSSGLVPLLTRPTSIRLLLTTFELIDDLNDVLNTDIYNQLFISTATGSDLDKYGDRLGIARNTGETDTAYRTRLIIFMTILGKFSVIEAFIDYFEDFEGYEVDFWFKYYFLKRGAIKDYYEIWNLYPTVFEGENLADGYTLVNASKLNYSIRFDLIAELTNTIITANSCWGLKDTSMPSVIEGLPIVPCTYSVPYPTDTDITNMYKIINRIKKICNLIVVSSYRDIYCIHNWNLQETSGTDVLDIGYIPFNGLNYNAVVGQAGVSTGHYSYQFNGTTAYLDLTDNSDIPSYKDFSISLWIKFSSSGSQMIMRHYNGGDTNFELRVSATNYVEFEYKGFTGSSKVLTSLSTLNDGAWHHIVVTVSDSEIVLYVDNNADDTESHIIEYDFKNGTLEVGKTPFFTGYIENINIPNWILTSDLVAFLYNGGNGRLL